MCSIVVCVFVSGPASAVLWTGQTAARACVCSRRISVSHAAKASEAFPLDDLTGARHSAGFALP